MQVFAVFAVSDLPAVSAKAEQHYPGQFYVVDSQTIFVATLSQTTQDVGTNLGFGEEGQLGIVVPVTSYWGRHQPYLWEWIAARLSNG